MNPRIYVALPLSEQGLVSPWRYSHDICGIIRIPEFGDIDSERLITADSRHESETIWSKGSIRSRR